MSDGVQATAGFTAKRQATVSGTVVDETGTPVAGARIWISDGRGPDERQFQVTLSDARGWFTLPIHGRKYIGARRRGMVTALAVPVDASRGDCQITLRMGGPAASVHGVVRDSDGRPVAWARVEIGPFVQFSGLAEATRDLVQAYGPQVVTGADGTFAFDDVDPTPKLQSAGLRAWAEGFAPHCSIPALRAGADTEVEIRLEPEAIVRGTVRDAAGAPVPGATVRVSQPPRSLWHNDPSTLSDDAGHFVLRDLPAGRVPFLARSAAGDATIELQLTQGQSTEWNPALGSGRSIRGIVFAPDGTPLVPMSVGFYDRRSGMRLFPTDRDGRFTLANVGDQPVDVEVGELRQEPLRVIENVAPDTDNLEIRLNHADLPTARIRGRLVDEHGGPVAASVGVPAHKAMVRVQAVQTDGTGAFDLGPLRPGRRQLDISTSERGVLLLEPVDLAPDQIRDLGTIRVPRPGSATFTMASADGVPLPRANMWLYTTLNSNGRSLGGVEIKDGKGRIDALPPGRWGLMGQTGFAPTEIEIRSDQTTHLDLRSK